MKPRRITTGAVAFVGAFLAGCAVPPAERHRPVAGSGHGASAHPWRPAHRRSPSSLASASASARISAVLRRSRSLRAVITL